MHKTMDNDIRNKLMAGLFKVSSLTLTAMAELLPYVVGVLSLSDIAYSLMR